MGDATRVTCPECGGDGFPEWPKGDGQAIAITAADLSTTREAWERDHRTCGECGGDGQVFAEWHIDHGYRYRTCTRCKGSGGPHAHPRDTEHPA
jgi:DnaJ-class molecular chaperone